MRDTSSPQQLIAGIRSFTARTLYNGLSSTRQEAEKQEILDALYGRLEADLLSSSPSSWADAFLTHLAIYTKV